MLHYTLNTGHRRVSPRSEVGDEIIPIMDRLLVAGTHSVPGTLGSRGYTIRVTLIEGALLVTVSHGERPLATWGVAADDAAADSLWPEVERAYLSITELPGIRAADFAAPQRPQTTPWIATMTILAEPVEAAWLADFERCLAWAWVEKQKRT